MSYQPPGYPPAQPAPPVDREVQGTLTGVEPRNAGWMRFLILEPGKQYPYKADTKHQDVIAQAMSLIGQPVSVQVREQDSTEINPHNNQPYKNRYLNAIAPAVPGYPPGVYPPGVAQPASPADQMHPAPPYAPPITTPPAGMHAQTSQPGISGFDKDMNIMRQTASKVVAMSIEVLPPEQRTPAGMVAACEAWLAYYVYGPLRFGVAAFSSPGGQQDFPQGMPLGGPEQPAQPPPVDPNAPCSDCGFAGGVHAIGCPQGIPS